MKMEKKQCTKCKKDLEISLFNLRGGQLTKCCVKCLDNFKKSRQRTRCDMEDKDQNARTVAGTIFVSITGEDHDARIVVGVKFVNTTSKDQHAKIAVEVEFVSTTGEDLSPKIVAEVKFVSTTSKDQYVKIVAEVKFVSTTSKDQSASCAIPLDILWGRAMSCLCCFKKR